MIDAYLNDQDVIDEMAKHEPPSGRQNPSMFGWTAELSALKDIQDQMIASRGGKQFVPRPVIKGNEERKRRNIVKLTNTIERITGSN